MQAPPPLHTLDRPRRSSAQVVLTAGVAATALVVALLWSTAADRDRHAFESEARDAQLAVLKRVETSVALLRGAAGLFAAFGAGVDAVAFRRYVDRLALREQYPGILGIGFTRRFPPADLTAIEQEMRAQGFAQFRVWPEHPRSELHSIVFLEPLDARNRAAIGYDMYTNPVRAEAMAKARDSAAPSASGVVELVQEIDELKQPGFLIYLPVYAGGAMPATTEERRERLLGFAYSPIRAGDFLSSSFRDAPDVALYVYHGTAPTAETLLYRTDATRHAARFEITETVDVAGQPWTFVFRSRSKPYEALALPAGVALAGMILSWLLAVLVRRQSVARGEAQRALERERAARA